MESMKKLYLKSWPGRKKEKKRRNRCFLENGSIFLKELIADCNGKSIPIRSFSSEQILKATSNFDFSCLVSQDSHCKWYRGKIDDRSYMIKRFSEEDNYFRGYEIRERVGQVYNDIVLSARMSNHSNFLKVLGMCLEFRVPVLLFEDAEHGALNRRGGIVVNLEESILPWSVRLKIAKEIANAVTYLHMAFPKIIIHRAINPTNIFLDKNWSAKLSDFTIAVKIPEGKSRIAYLPIEGTIGYIDPLQFGGCDLTEYTDVYSFGICLLVFITAIPTYNYDTFDGSSQYIASHMRGLYENGKLDEVIDPMMAKDNITSSQRLQVEACVVLALKCCEPSEEDRPKMIQVAKELKRIESSLK